MLERYRNSLRKCITEIVSNPSLMRQWKLASPLALPKIVDILTCLSYAEGGRVGGKTSLCMTRKLCFFLSEKQQWKREKGATFISKHDVLFICCTTIVR